MHTLGATKSVILKEQISESIASRVHENKQIHNYLFYINL